MTTPKRDDRSMFRRLLSPRPAAAALAICAAVPLVALVSSPPAFAAWSSQGSGGAAGAAYVMPTGSAPSGSANGLLITVSWPASTLPNGTAVAGYTVTRYNATTGAPVAVGGTCAGVVTTTTCSERVTGGLWQYTDTPVQLTWTGGESPKSASIRALG